MTGRQGDDEVVAVLHGVGRALAQDFIAGPGARIGGRC
jgi:hypothetical protein